MRRWAQEAGEGAAAPYSNSSAMSINIARGNLRIDNILNGLVDLEKETYTQNIECARLLLLVVYKI